MKKFVIMGLDSAAPDLVFGKLQHRMPNMANLAKQGVRGPLASTDPPITIPAWMSMMTGQHPGQLGLYGFRHRKGFSYDDAWVASSASIRAKTLWEMVGEAGGKSCVVGVPPTYPPKPINGWLVSCFITPDIQKEYTHPPELKKEIQNLVGEYVPDVEFRVQDRSALLKALYDMTEKHFTVIEHLMQEKPWEFFAFVEIGLDRVHHAFWKFFDSTHHLYTPGNPFQDAIPDYYAYLDKWIGRLLESIPKGTPVMVVSDHGAKAMKGAFCVNQWLASEGYLALSQPKSVVPLSSSNVDWAKTKAWGWGGYYARIFLNVKGREADGTIPPEKYEESRTELTERIAGIRGPGGEAWQTQIIRPEEVFDPCLGDVPDLMIYFDDLAWRSAGTVGHPGMYLPENDTGPDDAVHAKNGIYILSGLYEEPRWQPASILSVAPTVLKAMGLKIPSNIRGEPLCR